MFTLENKIALVTGSSKGLGLSFAKALGQGGAKVILNGRNAKTLEDARRELENDGISSATYPFDVTDSTALKIQLEKIEKEMGHIDILVNNAGLQIRGPLEKFPEKDWDRIMSTNLKAIYLVSKEVVAKMMQIGRGKIINVCSVNSELARATITPYVTSKGGLKMLTKGMATEWAKYGIQVNGIGPGYMKTEMTSALWQDVEFDAWVKKRTPAGRWGLPEELAGTLIFLASDASNYVNGQIIYVDGGMSSSL